MSDIVLQTIVDKLEAIEIAVSKQQLAKIDKIDDEANQAILGELCSFKNELKSMSASVRVSNEKANEMLFHLGTFTSKSIEPVNNRVTYHHQLHKGMWISIALFIVSNLLLIGWVNAYNTRKQYEANDIKYRHLKIRAGQYVSKILYNIDSLYIANGAGFIKTTIQEEEHNAEQIKLLRLADEKEKEAKELKAKAKESR